MPRLRGLALCLLTFVLAAALPAQAQKRVALVVGNSAYQHTSKLTNPKNDATDVAAALRKLGFAVIEGFDLDKAAFDRKVRDFASALKGAEVGVLFYAGHGLQVAGENYLVPIDAKAEEAATLEFEMLRVAVIHRIMEQQTNTNVLFLDACRDNPLARNLARNMGTRSAEIGRGLARIESGVGTLISFSTQPGNVALDGAGRNSPFAGALVKQLTTSTDDLNAILITVRNEVMQETQRKQVPWENSALTGRFYFNPSLLRRLALLAHLTPLLGANEEFERGWPLVGPAKAAILLSRWLPARLNSSAPGSPPRPGAFSSAFQLAEPQQSEPRGRCDPKNGASSPPWSLGNGQESTVSDHFQYSDAAMAKFKF